MGHAPEYLYRTATTGGKPDDPAVNIVNDTMKTGWSQGGARTHNIVRIYHFFKSTFAQSVCKRVYRDATHETVDHAPEGYRCAKCEERMRNGK